MGSSSWSRAVWLPSQAPELRERAVRLSVATVDEVLAAALCTGCPVQIA